MMEKAKRIAQSAKRLKQKIFVFLYLILTLCAMPYALCENAKPISSADLINNAKQYDGKEVVYSGEVIGDVMLRGNFAWINVNDTKNAIGIWLPSDLTKKISTTGSYKAKGDIIEVKGKFNRACPMHGGDLDIHAASLQIIKKGASIEEVISQGKIKAAIGFLIICLTLTVIYFIRLGYGS